MSAHDNNIMNIDVPERFTLGCTWGMVRTGGFFGIGCHYKSVDVDLSCVLCDAAGNPVDHVYSPLFRHGILARFGMPPGKTVSLTHAVRHSGDDLVGSRGNDSEDVDESENDVEQNDGTTTENEMLMIDTKLLPKETTSIYFFLNTISDSDFSQIPNLRLTLYSGNKPEDLTPLETMPISTTQAGHTGTQAIVLARLIRKSNGWTLHPIFDFYSDPFPGYTFHRIIKDYAKQQK